MWFSSKAESTSQGVFFAFWVYNTNMSEFPTEPTKRQRERQQAIATVISGMAYKGEDMHIDVEYIPPEWSDNGKISGMQDTAIEAKRVDGFNWETATRFLHDA